METFLVYVYDTDGRYGEPLRVSDDSLVITMRGIVFPAVRNRQKVIITDLMDLCVFHAEDGKVIFPPQVSVMWPTVETVRTLADC